MTPLILLAVLGVGAAVAVAAGRDMGIRFEDGCTSVVVYRGSKARGTLTEYARDASYQDPVVALDAWLSAVPGDTDVCFGLDENMLPAPIPGVSVPALPSRETAAVYLLYLDYMIDTFDAVRPGFDPALSNNVWQAIADRYQLTPADVNAVPVQWSGD